MNDTDMVNLQRLAVGAALFGTWIALVCFKVQNAGDIIDFCKAGLVGLTTYHITAGRRKAVADNAQGGAQPALPFSQ